MEYVRVPFSSIRDSAIVVSKDEIANYVKEHADSTNKKLLRYSQRSTEKKHL